MVLNERLGVTCGTMVRGRSLKSDDVASCRKSHKLLLANVERMAHLKWNIFVRHIRRDLLPLLPPAIHDEIYEIDKSDDAIETLPLMSYTESYKSTAQVMTARQAEWPLACS